MSSDHVHPPPLTPNPSQNHPCFFLHTQVWVFSPLSRSISIAQIIRDVWPSNGRWFKTKAAPHMPFHRDCYLPGNRTHNEKSLLGVCRSLPRSSSYLWPPFIGYSLLNGYFPFQGILGTVVWLWTQKELAILLQSSSPEEVMGE